jgi:predicted nucleic acid-binding protein
LLSDIFPNAIQFGKEIKTLSEEGIIQIVQIAEDIQTEAWKIFESYSDKDFSFTDCTSFVVCNLFE